MWNKVRQCFILRQYSISLKKHPLNSCGNQKRFFKKKNVWINHARRKFKKIKNSTVNSNSTWIPIIFKNTVSGEQMFLAWFFITSHFIVDCYPSYPNECSVFRIEKLNYCVWHNLMCEIKLFITQMNNMLLVS